MLGAGPAGEVCAGRLADGGLSVAIVERHLIGGECSYYACMPSKALLRPADVLAEARRVPGVAAAVTGRARPAGRPRSPRRGHPRPRRLRRSCPGWKNAASTSSAATARFDGERRLAVGDDVLTARKAIVVATGSGAAMPPIPGLDTVEPWNNRQATTAKQVPESMIVLGGGPVGSELSQAWSSLGTRVTLVEGNEHLLSREEAFAGEEVAASLRERFGVDVRTGVQAEKVEAGGAGVIATLGDGSRVEGAEILIAVGRVPHTRELDLDSAGVEPDEHGFLATDDRLRVGGRDWLYAIGDVNGRALFTHMGKYQAWVAAENLLGREVEAVAEDIGSPRVTFTDPQVAAVGKTLEQAREAGLDARAVDVPTDGTPGASFQGKGHRRHLPAGRRRGPRDDRRRHLHRLRDRRLPPGRDRRDRRRGAALAAAPRDRAVPQPQRDLAEAAGEVRRLSAGGAGAQTVERRFKSCEQILREAGDLVEVVDRLEAAEALAVGEQAGGLGDREVLLAQLLEGDGVEIDRVAAVDRPGALTAAAGGGVGGSGAGGKGDGDGAGAGAGGSGVGAGGGDGVGSGIGAGGSGAGGGGPGVGGGVGGPGKGAGDCGSGAGVGGSGIGGGVDSGAGGGAWIGSGDGAGGGGVGADDDGAGGGEPSTDGGGGGWNWACGWN